MIDAKGGTTSSHNATFNKITWQVGDVLVNEIIEKNYTIRSPDFTTPPTRYFFYTELTDIQTTLRSDLWNVLITDPPGRLSDQFLQPCETPNGGGGGSCDPTNAQVSTTVTVKYKLTKEFKLDGSIDADIYLNVSRGTGNVGTQNRSIGYPLNANSDCTVLSTGWYYTANPTVVCKDSDSDDTTCSWDSTNLKADWVDTSTVPVGDYINITYTVAPCSGSDGAMFDPSDFIIHIVQTGTTTLTRAEDDWLDTWDIDPSNTAPDITNIDVDDDFEPTPPDAIDLIAFSTKNVYCNGTVTDSDGGADISKVNATLYDVEASSPGSVDSNATHYTNKSCFISAADGNNKHFKCLFLVRYFANNATWQCNATGYDASNTFNSNISNVTINALVAISVPTTMDFGTLALGDTSFVNKTNITNAGNVLLDISIFGFANNQTNSSAALNCTTAAGIKSNISLDHLQYNVTDTVGAQCTNFGHGSNSYNLTNNSNEKTWTGFDLGKQNVEGILMRNYTCWVLQIPQAGEETIDPNGVCTGILSFVAVLDS